MQSENPSHGRAYFALFLICIIWGTSWVASKEAVKSMPALQMAGIRQLWAATLYIGYFLYKKHPWPKGRQWLPIIWLSILNFILSNGLSTWGVKFISAGLASIIGASFPLWLVILSFFRYKEKLSVLARIGLLIGFGGICIVFYDHLAEFLKPEFQFGIALSVIAAVTWAVGTIYTKEHALTFNPYFAIGLQMLISSFCLLGVSYATDAVIPLHEISWYTWANIAYLVLFSSLLAFIAYLYALQKLPTSLVSIYAYINPIIAVMIGGVFFHERLTTVILIGALVTVFGVYMVNAALRQKRIFFWPPRGRI